MAQAVSSSSADNADGFVFVCRFICACVCNSWRSVWGEGVQKLKHTVFKVCRCTICVFVSVCVYRASFLPHTFAIRPLRIAPRPHRTLRETLKCANTSTRKYLHYTHTTQHNMQSCRYTHTLYSCVLCCVCAQRMCVCEYATSIEFPPRGLNPQCRELARGAARVCDSHSLTILHTGSPPFHVS